MRRSSNSESPIELRFVVTIDGTGSQVKNIFKIYGSSSIDRFLMKVVRVGTLNNLTNLFMTIWDGTNQVILADDGAILSGAPVGTIITRSIEPDIISTDPLSVFLADQCRLFGVTQDGATVLQKHNTDTYIRLHYTTTDNPVDFDLAVYLNYVPLGGGNMEPVFT
jgi:hypothetical protein